MWQGDLDAGQTTTDKQIQVVECARLDLYQHFIGTHNRLGDVCILEDFRTAVLPEQHCFHDWDCNLKCGDLSPLWLTCVSLNTAINSAKSADNSLDRPLKSLTSPETQSLSHEQTHDTANTRLSFYALLLLRPRHQL
jgi:hypothetical protein